ncbi:hypothetical protein [Paenibacillus alvei]|uniref:Uncharacterized protein n=1 Tax=Paenibacillus alvei TaxID=44250 RepID=A0AAP6ZXF1_PAEAL|nr:hypothetical protein [Paenibacillus alvei]NOJ71718.1 hypothetical protein [Paenibacillus alvei]
MEKRRTSFANLIFFIPVTILSILMWNDYNRYVANIDDRLPSLSKIYYLDNGKKMVGLADEKLGGYSQAYLFDSATGTPLKEMKVRSNIYGTLDAAVYQHDGVIIPAYDDSFGVQLNYFRPSGEMEELAQGTLPLSSYSSLGLYTWRGRLFITGETADSELYLAEVENGKLRTSSMNSKDLFPARPVRLWKFPSNFDDDKAVPIFDVTLKDDRTAYVSGLLDKNNMPSVLLKKENESSFDAKDRAGVQFGRQFGFDSTKLVRVDSSYPGQAKFYNAAEKKWGAILPTPKPVYQAKVFLLNDREVLIAGSSAQDELNGSLLGYVYNEQTRRFIDVTELVNKLTYKDLKNTDLQFFKEIENDQLYYSFKSAAAGAFNMKTNIVQTQTSDQVKQWLVAEGEDKISLVSFWNYVKQGNALLINWVVWLAIPVLLYGGLAILMFAMKRKQSKNIAEGTIVPATIARMEETGTYINNQPLVRFTVRFIDEGQTKEVAIKKVLSFLNGVKVGDPVVISYNRRKNSAVFVTEDNIPEQDGLKMIKDAILSRIEERG